MTQTKDHPLAITTTLVLDIDLRCVDQKLKLGQHMSAEVHFLNVLIKMVLQEKKLSACRGRDRT